jgi:hypothetical protein
MRNFTYAIPFLKACCAQQQCVTCHLFSRCRPCVVTRALHLQPDHKLHIWHTFKSECPFRIFICPLIISGHSSFVPARSSYRICSIWCHHITLVRHSGFRKLWRPKRRYCLFRVFCNLTDILLAEVQFWVDLYQQYRLTLSCLNAQVLVWTCYAKTLLEAIAV